MKVEMTAELIAPCGFNCALCAAHQKNGTQKGYCAGCNAEEGNRQKHCSTCKRKNCPTMQSSDIGLCYDCGNFPCRRLTELDKRYRTRYNISMIQNLKDIQENGMSAFLENERKRWTCQECGAMVCVHKKHCLTCGFTR